jgi:hypothetical protein
MKDARTCLIAVCLLAGGCSVLGPRPDPSRFFALASSRDVEAGAVTRAAGGPAGEVTYGLGPIRLPAYLDRNEVVTRVSPTELAYSPTDRWAEPLSANVSAVLTRNLSAFLGRPDIVLYPWPGTVKVDYQVEVGLTRLERDAAGNGLLRARWTIIEVSSGRRVVVRESDLTRPGMSNDTAASAAALSDALGELCREIAAALQALPRPAASAPAR